MASAVATPIPDTSPISRDPAERARGLERLKRVLDQTAAVGGDVLCGPYYCPLGVFSGQEPSEDEKKWGADVIRAGAEHAQSLKLRIAIHFLCRFETYFLNTAAHAATFIQRVNHPACGMLYDTFHANIEEKDPPAALAAAGKHVIHFHVSENDRGTPGSGHVPWRETFQTLRRINYDGWLTIEAFSRVLPELAAATRVPLAASASMKQFTVDPVPMPISMPSRTYRIAACAARCFFSCASISISRPRND